MKPVWALVSLTFGFSSRTKFEFLPFRHLNDCQFDDGKRLIDLESESFIISFYVTGLWQLSLLFMFEYRSCSCDFCFSSSHFEFEIFRTRINWICNRFFRSIVGTITVGVFTITAWIPVRRLNTPFTIGVFVWWNTLIFFADCKNWIAISSLWINTIIVGFYTWTNHTEYTFIMLPHMIRMASRPTLVALFLIVVQWNRTA